MNGVIDERFQTRRDANHCDHFAPRIPVYSPSFPFAIS